MKKIYAIIALSFAVASCTSVNKNVFIKDSKLAKKRVRIAVMTFKSNNPTNNSGEIVANSIANEIIKIRNWDIVERMQINRIMKEQAFDASGATSSDYSKIGKLSGIDYIIVGAVSEFFADRRFYIIPKTRIIYQARIIDTSTGSVVATASCDLETGKHAWLGCCLSTYYIPIALLTDMNIKGDVEYAAKEIVEELVDELDDLR